MKRLMDFLRQDSLIYIVFVGLIQILMEVMSYVYRR